MKKKTIILLISILLAFIIGLNFNFNYAAAGDYYTDITQYTASDINDNNVTYVANLAKAYIQAHPELFSEPTTPSDPFFNYCYILLDYNTNNFAIYFSEDSSYIYTSSYSNGLRMRSDYSRTFALTSYNNFSVIFNFLIEGNTYVRYLYADICGESTNIDKEYVSTKVLSYDGDIKYRDQNFNFVNTITENDGNPTFYYNIQQSDLGYKVAITPLNVDCPYTLKCYFDGNYDNSYTLQDNVANFQTSNFIINENVKKVLFVCEHPDGAFSLEINLETLNFDNTGTTSGSGGNSNINLDEFYGTNVYITAKSIYNVTDWVTTITTHNMQSDYKLYYSYDGGLTLHDMGYKYGVNEYVVTTIKGEASKILFLVEDIEEGFIYTLDHVFYDTSFGTGNLFGNVESSVDIENFTIDDGIANIKNFFYSVYDIFMMIVEFISCLPMWIVVPLNTFLIILIILAVLEFIRG